MNPPYNDDAEAALLGSCMINRSALEHALGSVTVDDFYLPVHRAIFAAFVQTHAEGKGIDATTTAAALHSAGKLELVGGRQALLAMLAQTPGSGNVKAYAEMVADCSSRRRLIALAEDLGAKAYDPAENTADLVGSLERAAEIVRLPVGSFVPPIDVADLILEPDVEDFIVPKLIDRGDRIIWTAGEGVGKSELQLQLAVCLASGVHPFFQYGIRRIRVLLVDLENSRKQLKGRLRRLLGHAGDRYQGGLGYASRGEGIDLRNPRDFRWLDQLCEYHHPEVLVIGPLYKCFRVHGRESKSDETAAEEAAYALDRLRIRHGMAVSLEAHSPHGESGDRAGGRPYGASLWLRWPEFGIYLKPMTGETSSVELRHWRGARDRDRDWPSILQQGGPHRWPWVASEERRNVA